MSDADIDGERHPQWHRLLHSCTDQAGNIVCRRFRDLEQQLIMHRQDHAGACGTRRAAGELAVDVDHRALQDVGGCTLNRHIHRDAFGRRPDLAVPAGELRYPALPTEQCHDDTRLSR